MTRRGFWSPPICGWQYWMEPIKRGGFEYESKDLYIFAGPTPEGSSAPYYAQVGTRGFLSHASSGDTLRRAMSNLARDLNISVEVLQ